MGQALMKVTKGGREGRLKFSEKHSVEQYDTEEEEVEQSVKGKEERRLKREMKGHSGEGGGKVKGIDGNRRARE